MILLVKSGGEAQLPEWRRHLQEFIPGIDVRWWDDSSVAPEQVTHALVWQPEPGRLASYPNLRLIISSAVGVDHLLRDPALPRHLPILRMGGAETAQRMGEFVCLAALSLLRGMRRIGLAQQAGVWDNFQPEFCASDRRATVLGLGNLGARAAVMLRDLGFCVAGWARTPRALPGVTCFAGPEGFAAVLERSDILVNLLPETPATRGILAAASFARLPRGAAVINVGRGGHVDLDALRAALDSGQVSGAWLDVFEPEPLPPGHWLWTDPRVIVSPHVGALASVRGRARMVADGIAALARGETPAGLYDPAKGY